jgi:hypothetical protein
MAECAVITLFLENLELVAALGLKQLKQDFRWVMRECFQHDMFVVERFQHIVEQCFCAHW